MQESHGGGGGGGKGAGERTLHTAAERPAPRMRPPPPRFGIPPPSRREGYLQPRRPPGSAPSWLR